MPGYLDRFSGLTFGWNEGEDGWGGAVNRSLRTLAYRGAYKNIKGTVTTPPASPIIGDTYIVGANPSGWGSISPTEHQLVIYGRDATTPTTVQWFILQPKVGMPAFDEERGVPIYFYEGSWQQVRASQNQPILSDTTITGDGVTTPLSVVPPPAQIPSDWNATSGVARILNKPTIPTPVAPLTLWQGDSVNQNFTARLPRVAGSYVPLVKYITLGRVRLNAQASIANRLSSIATTRGNGDSLKLAFGVDLRVTNIPYDPQNIWLEAGSARSTTRDQTAGSFTAIIKLYGLTNSTSYTLQLVIRITQPAINATITGHWYAGLLAVE